MVSREKLMSCPFCGHEAEVIEYKINGKIRYQVECVNDMCGVNPTTELAMREADAIRVWNERREG